MKQQFAEMLPQLTEFLRSEAKTETVVGQQFQLGEFSCVPVIRVGMGFGSGSGEGDAPKEMGRGEGGGLAGGMGIEPIGFLVSRGSEITFVATRKPGAMAQAFEKVPGLIEKYFEQQKNASKETAQH